MKSNLLRSKLLALTLGSTLAFPAFAGPGSSAMIWRNTDDTAALAPAKRHAAVICTDSRPVTVVNGKWLRIGGRAPATETATKLVCTSCATPRLATKATDRNAHSPKANVTVKATHDCSKGCTFAATAD